MVAGGKAPTRHHCVYEASLPRSLAVSVGGAW